MHIHPSTNSEQSQRGRIKNGIKGRSSFITAMFKLPSRVPDDPSDQHLCPSSLPEFGTCLQIHIWQEIYKLYSSDNQDHLHNNYSYSETSESATCTICWSPQWRITFAADGKGKMGELVIYHNDFFMISSQHLWLSPKAVNRFKVLHYWALIRSPVCIHFKC